MAKEFEKSPLRSKKFIAFLVCEVLWKAIALVMIFFGDDLAMQTNLFVLILIAGFVDVVYIGGQAALDHYVRTAAIISGKVLPKFDEEEGEV